MIAELRLTKLAQVFESLDPSPFQERDLDRDAADYIQRWFADEPHAEGTFVLRVYLPLEEFAHAARLEEAIQNHFARDAQRVEQDLRLHWRIARSSLLFGIAFLVVCFVSARLLSGLGGPLWSTVVDGLVIFGWIALWRPGEMILYDWIPLARRRKLFRKLSQLRVELAARES